MLRTWVPITDLPVGYEYLADSQLRGLAEVWLEEKRELESGVYGDALHQFQEKLIRSIAIETGALERLYTIDQSITLTLIEHGFDAALIPHGATDKPAHQVIELIRSQAEAVEGLFDFVLHRRELSSSYIKELHATLTANQATTEALMPNGQITEVPLEHGKFKTRHNLASDESPISFAPPEHVDSEIDRLVDMHRRHVMANVPPEIESAWLHHRFLQIHPFEDGNGRVARCLASLVLISGSWFPLVILEKQRPEYIAAIREADRDDLGPLVHLTANSVKRSFTRALRLSTEVVEGRKQQAALLDGLAARFKRAKTQRLDERRRSVEALADALYNIVETRVRALNQDINTRFTGLLEGPIVIDDSNSGKKRPEWNSFQIRQASEQYGYYANWRDYSRWVTLKVAFDRLTELLISIHVPGPRYAGLLVVTASGYHRVQSDDRRKIVVDLRGLTAEPFYISYASDFEELKHRFNEWLDEAVLGFLNYWADTP